MGLSMHMNEVVWATFLRPSRMQMFSQIAKLSEDIIRKGGIDRVGNAYFINYKDKRRIIA